MPMHNSGIYKPFQPQASSRRTCLKLIGIGLPALVLAACQQQQPWHSTDLSGTLPPLAFTMTRASDGKQVTAVDYRGKVTLLYFGYTFCPDVCPATLLNISTMLRDIGPTANHIRVLFVTVDPKRDSLKVLHDYATAFGPQVVGLRGSDDQIAALAKRYRVAYSVQPAGNGHAYEVTHSSAVYVFDGNGDVRLLFSGLATQQPGLKDKEADLVKLAGPAQPQSLVSRILRLI